MRWLLVGDGLLTAIPVQPSIPFKAYNFYRKRNPDIGFCANGLAELYRPEGR